MRLLGETFDGVVGTDRYKAYMSIPIERRQIGWAHLKRNLTAFAERGGEIGDWGTEAIAAVEGVEPTNNAAERALRPQVLWRKGCFGADRDAGTQFVARILTVAATCRQH